MKKIIIANWKMNPASTFEAEKLFSVVKKYAAGRKFDLIIAPSFVHLGVLARRHGPIKLAAQDIFYGASSGAVGAYTGEVSGQMLKNCGASHVIVGHSERRINFGESEEIIHKKLMASFFSSLKPILCVGERERSPGGFSEIIREEISSALRGIPKRFASRLLLAYEPIWAISTTKGAKADTPQNVFETTIFIRRIVLDIWGKFAALKVPVLYGGSVNSKNVAQFLSVKGINGLLVGGASLDIKEFSKILNEAKRL